MKNFLVAAVVGGIAISGAFAADNAAPDVATAPASTAKSAETKPSGPAVAVDLGPINNGFKLGKKIIICS